jgi:hypothetical protein
LPAKKERLGYILSANMARAQRAMAIAMIAPVANGRGKGTLKILSDLDAYKTALDHKKEKEWLRGFWRRRRGKNFCRRARPAWILVSVNPERMYCTKVVRQAAASFMRPDPWPVAGRP